MLLVKGTILADVSDMFYADTIVIELREMVAGWLGHKDCTKEQAVVMLNWLFMYAGFQPRTDEEAVLAFRQMVNDAGLIPAGCRFEQTDKGVWAILG